MGRHRRGGLGAVGVLEPPEEGVLRTQEFVARAQEGMPEIIIGKPSFKWDDANSMGGQRFSVQLTGESTERLAELGDEVARVMSSVRGLESVRSEAREGDEEVQIVVNRQRAAALGLTARDVAQAVFSRLTLDDWSFDAEALFLVRQLGYTLVEVPVRWRDAAGTKVSRGRDAVRSAVGLARIRWNHARGRYALAGHQEPLAVADADPRRAGRAR